MAAVREQGGGGGPGRGGGAVIISVTRLTVLRQAGTDCTANTANYRMLLTV